MWISLNMRNLNLTMREMCKLSDFTPDSLEYLSFINLREGCRNTLFKFVENIQHITPLSEEIKSKLSNMKMITFPGNNPNLSTTIQLGKRFFRLNWTFAPHLKQEFEAEAIQAQYLMSEVNKSINDMADKTAFFRQNNFNKPNSTVISHLFSSDTYDIVFTHAEEIRSKLNSINPHLDKMIRIINENNSIVSKFTGYKNNFFNSHSNLYDQFINLYNQLLNDLNWDQFIAVAHIFGMTCLIIFLIKIICIYFGEYLITNFNLEQKYPKIARFIQLRRKIQSCYLFIYLILIVLIILGIIILNACLLLKII